MHRLAVIGNPIEHSLSPFIWQEFARNSGIELEYGKLLAEKETFDEIVNKFFMSGAKAMSVTAPFKAMAYQLANNHNHHTLDCLTGNLLIKSANGITIDNTDGVGLIDDIKRLGFSLNNKKILFIGNGSVIHSVLSAIEMENPDCVHLLMRNYDNLVPFTKRSNKLTKFSAKVNYDIIINTTPNNPENELFNQVQRISDNALVYDMIYTASTTLFMNKMLSINSEITTVNGLGMLIQQAKVAFNKVFGEIPDVEPLYLHFQERFK